MGIESFYVKIRVDKKLLIEFKKIFFQKDYYGKCLAYHLVEEEVINYINLTASIVNFLPAVMIIHEICEKLNLKEENIIEVNAISQNYKFKNTSEFMLFLYQSYERKIQGFNKEFGAFIIKPGKYYKTRSRLRKKYYTKIE